VLKRPDSPVSGFILDQSRFFIAEFFSDFDKCLFRVQDRIGLG
jgi:hypothetical protein